MEIVEILDKKLSDLASEFKSVNPETKLVDKELVKVKDSTDLLWKSMLEREHDFCVHRPWPYKR